VDRQAPAQAGAGNPAETTDDIAEDADREADHLVDATPLEWICRKQLTPEITVHVLAKGQNLMLCWIQMKKGTQLPVHDHPHEQVSYVVSGRVRWEIEGRHCDGRAGTAVSFPPNQRHGCLVLEDCVIVDAFTPLRQDYLDGAEVQTQASG